MKQPVPIFETSRISYYSLTALFAFTCDVIYDFFFFSVWKWSLFLTWCAGYYVWRYLVSFCWGMSHQEIRKRCHTSHTYNDLKDLKLILCKSKFYYFSGYCECCISFTWNWLPNSSICSTFNHQWLQGKFSTKLMNHEPVYHRWSMTP